MRTSETFKVGKHEYQVNMWHPDKAVENLTWLSKMIGDTLLGILVQVDSLKELADMDVDLKLLAPGVKSLLSNLNEKEVALKCQQFTEGMLCDGKAFKYETHFMGGIGHLMGVIVGVLKAQYQDFFDGLPVAELVGALAAKGSSSTPAS